MGLPFRRVNLRKSLPIARPRGGGGPPVGLRIVSLLSLAAVLISVVTVDPRPGVHGDRPPVALGLVLPPAGIAGSLPRREVPDAQRLVALLLATAGTCLLTAVQ